MVRQSYTITIISYPPLDKIKLDLEFLQRFLSKPTAATSSSPKDVPKSVSHISDNNNDVPKAVPQLLNVDAPVFIPGSFSQPQAEKLLHTEDEVSIAVDVPKVLDMQDTSQMAPLIPSAELRATTPEPSDSLSMSPSLSDHSQFRKMLC